MRTINVLVNTNTSTYDDTRNRAEAYLYSNFKLAESRDGFPEMFCIHGEDYAGFTAQAQAERLMSGLIAAKVVSY